MAAELSGGLVLSSPEGSPPNLPETAPRDPEQLLDLLDSVVEDSPVFHESAVYLDRQTEAFRKGLKHTIAAARNLSAVGKSYSDAQQQFCMELSKLATAGEPDSASAVASGAALPSGVPQQFSATVSKIASVMGDLQAHMQTLFASMQEVFVAPGEQFLKSDFKEAKQRKKKFESRRHEYKQAASKFQVQLRKHNAGGSDSRRQDLAAVKLQADLATFDHVITQRRLFLKRECDVLSWLCSVGSAQITFYHVAYDAMTELQPLLCEAQQNIDTLREVGQHTRQREDAMRAYLEQQPSEEVSSPLKKVRARVAGAEKQGYLYKHSSRGLGSWKRRWFVVRHGQLHYFRSWRDLKQAGAINLALCSVRMAPSVGRCCFEIVSKTARQYVLQAASDEEMTDWLACIQSAIASALELQAPDAIRSPRQTLIGQSYGSPEEVQAVLRAIPGNTVCADCGTADPVWASINLGMLLCIDCSGVHRSMGVARSQVKSVLLDGWDSDLVETMQHIGNDLSNSIWLQRAPQCTYKAVRTQRDEAIRAKYEIGAVNTAAAALKPTSPTSATSATSPVHSSATSPKVLAALSPSLGVKRHSAAMTELSLSAVSHDRVSQDGRPSDASALVTSPRSIGSAGSESITTTATPLTAMVSNASATEAAASANFTSLLALLASGADLNIGTPPPLLAAVQANQPSVVFFLSLQCRCDVNVCDSVTGDTALHVAARENRRQCVRILLRHKAVTDIRNSAGQTAEDVANAVNAGEVLQVLQSVPPRMSRDIIGATIAAASAQ
eukprot:TRINITY_DN14186_c0_g1_i1.p1 TRINITY_DN14186_c0_g1~~TRINITY_DN14186_c0_g1_i1.p1  ORF type:complete len:783 (-),score=167.07 TRINITY_DN14186_c0_g1_i1:56-2404(-)